MGDGQSGIGGALKDLLTNTGEGGLGGLVTKFDQAGLGEIIKGWISTGPNPGIGASQLEQVFGPDMLRDLASKTGLPLNDLLGGLSAHLPGLVDSMTPTGQMPSDSSLDQGLGGLLGSIFGKS
jgi:uncharacterized protein YidB (DUF937 family)